MLVQDKNITSQSGLIVDSTHISYCVYRIAYIVFCVVYFDGGIDDPLAIEVTHQAIQEDTSVFLLFEFNQAIRE